VRYVCFPFKPCTLAGFEPRSSFTQADALTTAARTLEIEI
jgi:hypothetical protein